MQRWTHSDLERRWQLHCFRLIRNALKNSSGPRDTEQVWLGRTIETQALNLKQSKLNKCDARLIILKLAILCSEPVICSWSEFGIVTCRIDQIANCASAQQFFQNFQRFSLLKVATVQREWLPHQIVKLYKYNQQRNFNTVSRKTVALNYIAQVGPSLYNYQRELKIDCSKAKYFLKVS